MSSLISLLKGWLACALAFTMLSVCTASYSKETVTWAVLDFPPFQIRTGEFQGTGSFDGLLDLLIRELPEYEHDVQVVSNARLAEELRSGRIVCSPGLFKTPAREKLMDFSVPALIHLDNRLVIGSHAVSRFSGAQTVDLSLVLERNDLIGGVSEGRSFAPNIDPLIQQHAHDRQLVNRPIQASQLFKMLASGDIDYTILFPHEAAYLSKALNLPDVATLRSIKGTPPYIFTHVVCPKTAWGQQFLAKVNRVIEQRSHAADYRALSARWYKEPDQARIRTFYPKFLEAQRTSP